MSTSSGSYEFLVALLLRYGLGGSGDLSLTGDRLDCLVAF
jgi:hypothetical protein